MNHRLSFWATEFAQRDRTLLVKEFTTEPKSSRSSRLAPARSDVSRLIFFNVEHELGLSVAGKLSELYYVDSIGDSAQLQAALQSSIELVDAVLFGVDLDDPLSVAQRIHSLDKRLPIIILSSAAQSAQLRADLMISPFLGYEVLIWPTTDIEGLPAVLADAAQRRQQRQRYQEATLANAHVRLEVLPLLQPEAAE